MLTAGHLEFRALVTGQGPTEIGRLPLVANTSCGGHVAWSAMKRGAIDDNTGMPLPPDVATCRVSGSFDFEAIRVGDVAGFAFTESSDGRKNVVANRPDGNDASDVSFASLGTGSDALVLMAQSTPDGQWDFVVTVDVTGVCNPDTGA